MTFPEPTEEWCRAAWSMHLEAQELTKHHWAPKETTEGFILYSCISAFLVIMAGLMSGLTLGLMSLDSLDLEVLRRSGTPKEQAYAKRLEGVLKRPHWLLVTLVLCNAAASETLPIFLDRLADPITAIIISVSVVLVFGEIIPQAVCSRHGLAVGAHAAWFVQALMYLCGVVAYPISLLLDWILGHEHATLFRRAQLKALVDVHGQTAGLGGNLSVDEVQVIRGALDLTHKTAINCMTPLDKVFMVPADAKLDEETMTKIYRSGHSRIPVHKVGRRDQIIGIFLAKELMLMDKQQEMAVTALKLRSAPYLRADIALYDMLRLFETGRCHMAVLTQPLRKEGIHPAEAEVLLATQRVAGKHLHMGTFKLAGQLLQGHHTPGDGELTPCSPASPPDEEALLGDASEGGWLDADVPQGEPLGIITIEDIIEELIQQEIVDETDRYVDREQMQRVNAGKLVRNLPPRLRKLLLSRQFQPRVGRLAAVKSREALQHRLLTSAHEQAAAAASVGATVVPLDEEQSARVAHSSHKPPQKAASERNVTDRRLFQAIDLLKPLLAEAEGHDSSEHPATSGSTAPSGPNAV